MILGKEEFCKYQNAVDIEEVDIPEWDGKAMIKNMLASERAAFESSVFLKAGKIDPEFRSKFLVKCLVDDKGKRLFKDNEYDIIGNIDAKIVYRLYDEAARINGMGAKDAEELLKNSESGQSDGSASGSPES